MHQRSDHFIIKILFSLKSTIHQSTGTGVHHARPTQVSPSKETPEILSRAERYLLPVYERPPFVLSHGDGSYVYDTDGRKYLDFSAGIAVNALGHGDDGVVQVRTFQPFKLFLIACNLSTDTRRTSPEPDSHE